MIEDASIRQQKLQALRSDANKVQGRQKLYYKADTQWFDIFRIDLDWLIYNRHNGRLDAEMITWEKEHAISQDHYDAALHDRIDQFLWETNPTRNRVTLEDLRDKGQQRPGIVSLDGVVIDGNRRLMLLRRLQQQTNTAQFFDAIILPDAYHENEKEIVRLETQYQLGEDQKLEYGPLQKYLHARRLYADLDIPIDEIAKLMGEPESEVRRLLETVELMDDYLAHIGCPGLYLMLKDSSGTKEGMFVDLQSDLKRLRNGSPNVTWDYEPELDVLQLKSIQFDYMRLNDFADAKKSYREISHQGRGKNYFSHEDIWGEFSAKHLETVDTVTSEMGSLDDYMAAHPEYKSRLDAARARDDEWQTKVRPQMKANFGRAGTKLEFKVSKEEPREYLWKALLAIQKVDINSESFYSDPEVSNRVKEINSICWEMKKALDRGRP